jgi:hypothetical protein
LTELVEKTTNFSKSYVTHYVRRVQIQNNSKGRIASMYKIDDRNTGFFLAINVRKSRDETQKMTSKGRRMVSIEKRFGGKKNG